MLCVPYGTTLLPIFSFPAPSLHSSISPLFSSHTRSFNYSSISFLFLLSFHFFLTVPHFLFLSILSFISPSLSPSCWPFPFPGSFFLSVCTYAKPNFRAHFLSFVFIPQHTSLYFNYLFSFQTCWLS
ncbi:hypothetical protein XENOCAPTIV_017981 [Xenoophorus captivus]